MAQSYFPTAQGIIDASLLCIRAIDPEGSLTPTTTQRANALITLNMIVTSWQAKGMQVWCTKTGTLTLVASQNSYTMGTGGDLVIARPTSVQQGWLHNISANSDPIPLDVIGREAYNQFTQKAAAATPHSIWYDPQYDLPASNSGTTQKGKLYVYPTPDATIVSTYSLQFVYTRPIADFVATSDGLDFPQEWFNALKWNLADQLCPDFGVPVMYWDRIAAKAKVELDNVSGWDHESGSVFLQPTVRR